MGPLADWDARTDILSELDRSAPGQLLNERSGIVTLTDPLSQIGTRRVLELL